MEVGPYKPGLSIRSYGKAVRKTHCDYGKMSYFAANLNSMAKETQLLSMLAQTKKTNLRASPSTIRRSGAIW